MVLQACTVFRRGKSGRRSGLGSVPASLPDGGIHPIHYFRLVVRCIARKIHRVPAPEAKLRTFVLPGSGHAVNLARNTADYQAEVVDWMDTTIGK